jgi:hypothetical protein
MFVKGLSILLIFSNNQPFVSLILCIVFWFDIIDLSPDLYYFTTHADCGFVLVFLGAEGASLDCLFERSLFFNVGTYSHKLSP